MDHESTIPELLVPLRGRCRVLAGDNGAEAVMHAVRDALGHDEGFRTLRSRPKRAVYEFKTREGDFVVKAYEASFKTRMSPLRHCRSGREWKASQSAIERGVPTSRAVGLFRCKGRPGANYLVLERITGAVELDSYLAKDRRRLHANPELARHVVRRLARFVAGLHRAGLLHHALHARNILVRPPRAGREAEYFVLDLAEDDLKPATPPEHERRQNLALFALGFMDVPNTMRRRFLREYRAAMGDEGAERDVVNGIESQAVHIRFDRNTELIGKCSESSAEIIRVERSGAGMLIRRNAREIDGERLESAVKSADAEKWRSVIRDHLGFRVSKGHLWTRTMEIERLDDVETRRQLEAVWGRMLELDAIGVSAPRPLVCMLKQPELTVFAGVPGEVSQLVDHDDARLYEQLGRELVRLHRFGCFFLPRDPARLATGLGVCGGQSPVLCAPEHIFRASPTTLGPQAVSSLGRVARTILQFADARRTADVVEAYASVLRLKREDRQALVDEAHRVPSGDTLVMTRGIERSRVKEGRT